MKKTSRDKAMVALSALAALAIAGCGAADQPSRRQAALDAAVSIEQMVLADEDSELCEHLTDSTRVKLTLLFARSMSADRCPAAMHRFAALVSGSRARLQREAGEVMTDDVTFEGGIAVVRFSDTTKALLREVDGRWYLTLPPEPSPRITTIR